MDGDPGHEFGFGRALRIKQSRDFARTRAEGQRLGGGSMLANWRALPSGSVSRLGIVTSAKIGPAVKTKCGGPRFRGKFTKHKHEFFEPGALVPLRRKSNGQKKHP